ncbi:unnamed protein product, partial [Linum tenue]
MSMESPRLAAMAPCTLAVEEEGFCVILATVEVGMGKRLAPAVGMGDGLAVVVVGKETAVVYRVGLLVAQGVDFPHTAAEVEETGRGR